MLAGVLCLNPWHIIAVRLWCDAAKSLRYQVGDARAADIIYRRKEPPAWH
jgi:hypothetical protein